eukprot:231191-Chlamydomonas_euryale.AAC.10
MGCGRCWQGRGEVLSGGSRWEVLGRGGRVGAFILQTTNGKRSQGWSRSLYLQRLQTSPAVRPRTVSTPRPRSGATGLPDRGLEAKRRLGAETACANGVITCLCSPPHLVGCRRYLKSAQLCGGPGRRGCEPARWARRRRGILDAWGFAQRRD